MRPLRLPFLLSLALPFSAAEAAGSSAYNATERYVIAGQDEAGYRTWYQASPAHPLRVAAFHHYLVENGAGWVLPTWQIIRTASDWSKCSDAAFEVPPTSDWPNVVQTLRFIRDEVVPAIGPVESVSAYRNLALNSCAGGAAGSAHTGFYALDLVPLNPVDREVLIATLCDLHRRRGEAYGIGLGFYAFHRFHVDSKGYRSWGPAGMETPCAPPKPEPEAEKDAEVLAN